MRPRFHSKVEFSFDNNSYYIFVQAVAYGGHKHYLYQIHGINNNELLKETYSSNASEIEEANQELKDYVFNINETLEYT